LWSQWCHYLVLMEYLNSWMFLLDDHRSYWGFDLCIFNLFVLTPMYILSSMYQSGSQFCMMTWNSLDRIKLLKKL
jgi:hypothetical protein